MTRPSHMRPVDARMEHRAAAQPAITAASTVVATHQQRAQTRTEFVTRINIEAIKVSAGNEEYTFALQVSNDDFTTIETAAMISLGDGNARLGGANVDTPVGAQREIHWCTEVDGVHYKDWRLVLLAAGTGPSIAFSAISS